MRILTFLFFVALLGVSFKLYSDNKSLLTQVEDLKKENASLQEKVEQTAAKQPVHATPMTAGSSALGHPTLAATPSAASAPVPAPTAKSGNWMFDPKQQLGTMDPKKKK